MYVYVFMCTIYMYNIYVCIYLKFLNLVRVNFTNGHSSSLDFKSLVYSFFIFYFVLFRNGSGVSRPAVLDSSSEVS